jgi:hypothetical protein
MPLSIRLDKALDALAQFVVAVLLGAFQSLLVAGAGALTALLQQDRSRLQPKLRKSLLKSWRVRFDVFGGPRHSMLVLCPMKATFDWSAWWQAERVGVIYAILICGAMFAAGIFILATEGSWFLILYGLGCTLWCVVYCAGWHLLVLGILKLRMKLGLIAYQPARPAQGDR